jgi:hypothetical protein
MAGPNRSTSKRPTASCYAGPPTAVPECPCSDRRRS